jgi:hypothetical protein
VVGTRALFQREEPVADAVAHDLLQVFEIAIEAERIFTWECVEDGEDVALAC